MIDLKAAILAAILRLAGPWEDPAAVEPPAERVARLETIATATAQVATEGALGWRWSARELAAGIVAVTYPESQRFSRDVHAGERRGDRGRAACLGQVHASPLVTRAEWRASMGVGIEPTTLCLRLVARVLGASSRCVAAGRELDALQFARIASSYGTGHSCSPRLAFARERGWHWSRLDRQLEGWLEATRSALV